MTKTEIPIKEGSCLIGKTKEEVEKNYQVSIDHGHNPGYQIKKRAVINSDDKLRKDLIVKASGSFENISSFISAARNIDG